MIYLLEHEYCKAATQPSDVQTYISRVAHYAQKCSSALQIGLLSPQITWTLARGLYKHALAEKCDVVLNGFSNQREPCKPVQDAYETIAGCKQFNFCAKVIDVAHPAELVLIQGVDNLEFLNKAISPITKYIIVIHHTLADTRHVADYLAANPQWVLTYKQAENDGALFFKRKQ
jgi:hypothetical protein